LICLVYPQVVFLGKSLNPSLYYPPSFNPPGYAAAKPVNTFNIDLSTPAFYEMPVNKLTGEMYAKGEMPLWNPFQGCGTPLLAQYSTRVLFPYQILEDLSPWWLWDFFMLGRLLLAGFFTFLFLRFIGLTFSSSFLGGIFYMFSGSFTWFINCEQFVNTAMTIPLFLYTLERLWRFKNLKEIGFASLGLFCVLSAGQPEIALYVCFLGFLYYVFRAKLSLKAFVRFMGVVLLGTGLSLPVILPFLELVKHSFTPHPFMPHEALHMGIISPTPYHVAISLFLPTFFQVPMPFETLPANGAWDYLGGYIPLSCLYFLIAGLFLKDKNRKFFLFFFLFGLGVILKDFGVPFFKLLGHLPLFNQSWSPRWAGCVWVFSLSVAGAIGFEALITGTKNKKASKFALGIIFILIGYFFWRSGLIQKWDTLSKLVQHYLMASAFMGFVVSLVILAVIFFLTILYKDQKAFSLSIITLVLGEMWFYIPKGFKYTLSNLCIFSLLIIFLASILIFKNKKKLGAVLLALSFLTIISINIFSPFGFPERKNPFPEKHFIKFLKSNLDNYRFTAAETIIFPNFASGFSLYDVKFINSLSVEWYQYFIESHLLGEEYMPGWPAARLWFTAIPISGNRDLIYEGLIKKLKFYSLLGVKFIVVPKNINLDLPVAYEDSEVRIYKNPGCLPRAFVAHNILYAKDWRRAQDVLKYINLREDAVLEDKVGLNISSETIQGNSLVSISEYAPHKIILEAQLTRDGILVLTDTFYPGWQAHIDGKEGKILRVDGFLKGVPLKKGKHNVVISYSPKPFIAGAAIGAMCLLVAMFFIFKKK